MSTVHTHPETMSEEAYREFALYGPGGKWELVRGHLREKPAVTVAHSRATIYLVAQLNRPLNWNQFVVNPGMARLRVSSDTYYMPDVAVIPTDLVRSLGETPHALDAYDEPLPLVIEVWSPSTGKRDIALKLPDYQRRGDREIWFVHPYERTVTPWRRMPDGVYVETTYREGMVTPASLPQVAMDLDELFGS